VCRGRRASAVDVGIGVYEKPSGFFGVKPKRNRGSFRKVICTVLAGLNGKALAGTGVPSRLETPNHILSVRTRERDLKTLKGRGTKAKQCKVAPSVLTRQEMEPTSSTWWLSDGRVGELDGVGDSRCQEMNFRKGR